MTTVAGGWNFVGQNLSLIHVTIKSQRLLEDCDNIPYSDILVVTSHNKWSKLHRAGALVHFDFPCQEMIKTTILWPSFYTNLLNNSPVSSTGD
jgi:hypothetical protein